MNIDWSKAPEGATHAAVRDDGTMIAWLSGIASSHRMVERPIQWTGEGRPPVGVVCEVLWDSQLGIYCAAAVLAHDEAGAVYRFTTGERKGEYQSEQQDYYGGLPKFRPIRTPEQIAAEERDKTVRKILDEMPDGFPNGHTGAVVDWMLGQGYRKFEIVEE